MACEADHVKDTTSSGAKHSNLLLRLLHNTKTHDVKFLFGQCHLGAHRNILAERSPAFDAMFYGAMKEQDPSAGICVEDCTIEAFTAMLEWIYTDKVTVTSEIAQTLLYNAKKYMLEDLLPVLRKWLEDNLNNDTACVLWQQAVLLNETDFASKCAEFCFANADKVLASHGVVKLPRDQLKTLLSHEDAKITDELNAYQAVIRWGRKQCAIAGANADDMKALRAQVADLVQLVRLPLLSPEKLSVIVRGQDNVMPSKTMMNLLAWSAAKPGSDVEQCSFGDWTFCVISRQSTRPAPQHLPAVQPNRFEFVPSLRVTFPDKLTAVAAKAGAWNGVDIAPNLPTTGSHFVQCQRFNEPDNGMIGVSLCSTVVPQGRGYIEESGLMFSLYYGSCWTRSTQIAKLCKAPAPGDIIGCRLDMDKRTVEFTVNGESVGTPFTNIAPGQYKFSVCAHRDAFFLGS
eukprot:TRINITY_DN140_c0_g1_i11.p1 TRINITY_DN140_c0_g1~~TRINITY_DN140_c0_g1_i11.p1  ORF type:complete len:458 (-),score=83.78 TRINITY_DN140_c0_g1_i11:2001-3374(-)